MTNQLLTEIRNLLKFQIRNSSRFSTRSVESEGGPSSERQEQCIDEIIERAAREGK